MYERNKKKTNVSIPIHRLTDPRRLPYIMMLSQTVFSMYLANFAQHPKIKEFWRHKLSQKKTNLQETLLKIKSPVSQLKRNQVGIQNIA